MSASERTTWWSAAPALRFLAAFLLLWVGVRVMSPEIWAQRAPAWPPVAALQDAAPWPVNAVEEPPIWPPRPPKDYVAGARVMAQGVRDRSAANAAAGGEAVEVASVDMPLLLDDTGSMAAAAHPPSSARIGLEVGTGAPLNVRKAEAVSAPSAQDRLAWRGLAGWSLSAWALLREKGGASAPTLGSGELAGSQAGARLAYGFGEKGRLRAYARASTALQHMEQSELAAGLTYTPFAALPVDVALERREKLGSGGRSAMAAMLVGGFSGQAMPLGFQLDGYGQAGVVGFRRRDMFVDGALVLDRSFRRDASASALRVGAVLTGAAQPDLSRLDIGPRVTLPLPQIGRGARIAVDWRERISGNAKPDGGLALTLGADF